MKKKALLDVLFASEKRKNVMLLLRDGPREMSFLLENLSTSRPALLPQVKVLKDRCLVYQSDDTYGLTITGKLIADQMQPFLDTIETLDESGLYFRHHKVDAIPEHFLERINEVRDLTVIEPEYVNSIELNADYLNDCLASKAVYFVYTFMHPGVKSVLDQLVAKGIEVSVIFSDEFFNKLVDEIYDTVKYTLTLKNINFYVYEKDMEISSLTVTDSGFLLRLLSRNNEFSNKQVKCSSPEGRKWGKDLYEHYLKDAKMITEI